MSHPTDQIFQDLERNFAAQLARIEAKLRGQSLHTLGPRKPTLEEQEAILVNPDARETTREP